jgi:hypothetical protein
MTVVSFSVISSVVGIGRKCGRDENAGPRAGIFEEERCCCCPRV